MSRKGRTAKYSDLRQDTDVEPIKHDSAGENNVVLAFAIEGIAFGVLKAAQIPFKESAACSNSHSDSNSLPLLCNFSSSSWEKSSLGFVFRFMNVFGHCSSSRSYVFEIHAMFMRSRKTGQAMGRGKIEIRKIENPISRQVTFSKRRKGLLKKAHELSVLCDAQIGLIVFSERGKMKEYCSNPPGCMKDVIERYCRANNIGIEDIENKHQVCTEVMRMRCKNDEIESRVKWYMGQELTSLSFNNLNQLEEQLEVSVHKVRARKNQLLQQQFENLRRRAQLLEDENGQYRQALDQQQVTGQAAIEYKITDAPILEEMGQFYGWENQRNSHHLPPEHQEFRLYGDTQDLTLNHQGF
ncbi:MADS-box protein GGM13-like [Wolffia australiana]